MKAFYLNELKHLQIKEKRNRSWNSSKLWQTGPLAHTSSKPVSEELSWTSNTSEHAIRFCLFTLVHSLSFLFISSTEVPITKVTSEYIATRKKPAVQSTRSGDQVSRVCMDALSK